MNGQMGFMGWRYVCVYVYRMDYGCGVKDVFVCVFLCVHEEIEGEGMEIRVVCVYMCDCVARD